MTPASSELYALESARQYDECYGLAYAQQLKNKDIPEGGSKAVNLIKPWELHSGHSSWLSQLIGRTLQNKFKCGWIYSR